MPSEPSGPPRKPIWTYAYRIAPPQSEQRMRAIKLLLDAEHAAVGRKTSTFEARLVLERHVTDILVVTDSPDQDRDVNRRMAAELDRLNVDFSVTAPLAVSVDPSAPDREPDGGRTA